MDPTFLASAGRVLVGALFVGIGVRLLLSRRPVAMLLATKSIPQPLAVTVIGGAIEIVLGLAALAGVGLPIVFLGMAAFVIVATLMVHDFWRKRGMARALETNIVLSHALLVGGLLVMAAYPW